MDFDINFLMEVKGRKYVVMAKVSNRGGSYKMDLITIYLIRRNGSIVRRKVWDVTNSLSKSKTAIIWQEVFRRAKNDEF